MPMLLERLGYVEWSEDDYLAMNARFADAMASAIAAGVEHLPQPAKEPATGLLRHIPAREMASYVGSPAASCETFGDA